MRWIYAQAVKHREEPGPRLGENLTMRMGMRRFTRLTNACSKKAGRPTTPAMAAGVESHPWSTFQVAALLD